MRQPTKREPLDREWRGESGSKATRAGQMTPRVISDREIYACARLLILEHGEQAGTHAAKKADALLKAGDLAGQNTWLRIERAIGELQSRARPADAPVH